MSNVMAVGSAEDRLALAVTGLEPSSATTLRAAFETMFAQAEEWTTRAKGIVVTSVDQKREMKLARESRLALREIRVNAEHSRKRLKEDSLRQGKAIDGICSVLKALIEPIEAHLLEQETFAERAEAVRKDALRQARSETLRALGADPAVYADLGATDEATWVQTLENAQSAHDARIEAAKQAEAVRVEAERIAAENRSKAKAEAARVEAERVERERAAAEENARLRQEALEREAEAKADREREAAARAEDARLSRVEAERVASAARAERAELEEAQAAERARMKATLDAQAEEQRLARVKAAEEAQAREAAYAADREKVAAEQTRERGAAAAVARELAETKAKAERLAASEAEAAKPTKAKYAILVSALENIADGKMGHVPPAEFARLALVRAGARKAES